ncbi:MULTISPECIES: antibiotic biosynthesis monooxygenase [Flavobacteriaceae]|uniref:antibiotic biosynthesis monooxygenase family protein n=1 Tax=Flavobacteriaceae TaxID=49546 RepID=UPI00149128EC|nr:MULTISPECIES: antibiotic biosynthesis monooxygenase [Allomuricauda]MDC6367167.1 antibiotic biosynthesis monooxygenase [Muricauda sp. AC10]
MFAVIYQFKVIENKEADFIKSWKKFTELIYQYEGSLGSRLHKQKDGNYIAYAQWPNRDIWSNSGKNLPDKAKEAGNAMRESCSKIEVLFELENIEDLLKNDTWTQ